MTQKDQQSSQLVFRFMKYRFLYLAISLCVIIPGCISLLFNGLRPSIDFTGGSLLEFHYSPKAGQADPLGEEQIRTALGDAYVVSAVQPSGDHQLILRGKQISNEQKDQVLKKLEVVTAKVEELRFETVGPVLGKELIQKTFFAVLIVSVGITLYVWHQFHEAKYGVSAILAMFHDTLVLLGTFSILGHFFHVEVDVLFVTALLTTLSFSVHDTIVVYDRIREIRKKQPRLSFLDVSDVAVLETLGRSINNSMTIIVMLLTLAILGGDSIRWFVVALLVGAITGTYSSTFTAVPLILLWESVVKKRQTRK